MFRNKFYAVCVFVAALLKVNDYEFGAIGTEVKKGVFSRQQQVSLFCIYPYNILKNPQFLLFALN